MKNKFNKFLFGVLLFGSSCYFGAQETIISKPSALDNVISDYNKKDVRQILMSTYEIKHYALFEKAVFDENGKIAAKIPWSKSNFGTCFAFARDGNKTYFFTAKHCLNFDIEKNEFPTGKFQTSLMKYSDGGESELGKLREIESDPNLDIAILESENLDNNIIFYNKFLDSSCLSEGDTIYSVGFPHGFKEDSHFSWGRHITHGIITSIDSDDLFLSKSKIIFSEAVLDGGMSGGPSFVIHGGIPYIAGLNISKYPTLTNKYGIGVGVIDMIKRSGLEKLIINQNLEVREKAAGLNVASF